MNRKFAISALIIATTLSPQKSNAQGAHRCTVDGKTVIKSEPCNEPYKKFKGKQKNPDYGKIIECSMNKSAENMARSLIGEKLIARDCTSESRSKGASK